jgi:hypothetical protein
MTEWALLLLTCRHWWRSGGAPWLTFWKSIGTVQTCKSTCVLTPDIYWRVKNIVSALRILDCIAMCFYFDFPVPAWVKNEFSRLHELGTSGGLKSWDKVFGHPTTSGRLARRMRDETNAGIIFHMIQEAIEDHRAPGARPGLLIPNNLGGVSAGPLDKKPPLWRKVPHKMRSTR